MASTRNTSHDTTPRGPFELIAAARALEPDWGQNEQDAIDLARRLADALEAVIGDAN